MGLTQLVRGEMSAYPKKLSFSLWLLTSSLFFGIPLLSEATDLGPDATLRKIIAELKQEGHHRVLLHYIHFETEFASLTEQEKTAFGVNSPSDLKEWTSKSWEDPEGSLEQLLEREARRLHEEGQQVTRQKLEQRKLELLAAYRAQNESILETIKRGSFAVGTTRVSGGTASVQLTTKIDGKETAWTILMVKDGGRWLLSGNARKWLLAR